MIDLKTGKELSRRDFGKGIAAILAAGCAPTIVSGAMMRMTGARNSAVFGVEKKEQGLVCHWDASVATGGENLVSGGPSFTYSEKTNDYYYLDGNNSPFEIDGLSEMVMSGLTIELVARKNSVIIGEGTLFDACTTSLSNRGFWCREGNSTRNYLVFSVDYRSSTFNNVNTKSYDGDTHVYEFICNGTNAHVVIDNIPYNQVTSRGVTNLSNMIRFSNGIVYSSRTKTYVYVCKVYNRVLLNEEIKTHYDYYRSRFGLT